MRERRCSHKECDLLAPDVRLLNLRGNDAAYVRLTLPVRAGDKAVLMVGATFSIGIVSRGRRGLLFAEILSGLHGPEKALAPARPVPTSAVLVRAIAAVRKYPQDRPKKVSAGKPRTQDKRGTNAR